MKKQTFFVLIVILFQFNFLNAAGACNLPKFLALFDRMADMAENVVLPADKAMVMEGLAPYPEGGNPPVPSAEEGEYDVEIPSKAAAYYVAGVVAAAQDSRIVATWCFLEAAKRNPDEPIYLNNVGFVLLEFGLYDLAKEVLECAKSLAPDFPSVYVNLGFAETRLGYHGRAAVNYLTAALYDPTNEDYLRLAAQAAHRVGGVDSLVSAMGEIATQAGWDDDEWTSLLEDLDYHPDPPEGSFPCPTVDGCPCNLSAGTVCPHRLSDVYRAACAALRPEWEAFILWVAEYELDNIAPIFRDADETARVCNGNNNHLFNECRRVDPTRNCHCLHLPNVDRCYVTANATKVAATNQLYWAAISRAHAAGAAMRDILSGFRDDLTTSEYETILNCIDGFVDMQVEIYAADVADQIRDLRESKTDYAGSVVTWCTDSDFEVWVFTSEVTVGLEPNFCFVVLCFSYDLLSGQVGLQGGAVVTGKLSVNPFTGERALQTGIGGTFGAGPATAGGGVYLKFTDTAMGVEPKLTLGPLEVGYFMGFERLE